MAAEAKRLFSLLLSFFILLAAPIARGEDIKLVGQYARIENDSIEIVYQVPTTTALKGLLVVFHGCSHRATDFFPASATCKKCIGLPVERTIAMAAIRRGIAVLAISSQNAEHKCWVPHQGMSEDYGEDIIPVSKAIKHFYSIVAPTSTAATTLTPLKMTPPLFLLGASSGGSFVGTYGAESKALGTPASAICVQISGVRQTSHGHLPPTLFVHMAQDSHTSRVVARTVEQLTKKTGSGSAAQQHACLPKPLVPSYFADHGAALAAHDSATLVAALKEAGFVDGTSGRLKYDPRSSDWRPVATKALPAVFPALDTLKADESPVSELLNLAWGEHEITDEYLDETMQWFLDHA